MPQINDFSWILFLTLTFPIFLIGLFYKMKFIKFSMKKFSFPKTNFSILV